MNRAGWEDIVSLRVKVVARFVASLNLIPGTAGPIGHKPTAGIARPAGDPG